MYIILFFEIELKSAVCSDKYNGWLEGHLDSLTPPPPYQSSRSQTNYVWDGGYLGRYCLHDNIPLENENYLVFSALNHMK